MRQSVLIVPAFLLLACARSDSTADTTAAASGAPTPSAATPTGGATTTAAAAGDVQPSQLVDPNSATREQLSAAGLDSAAASAVIAGRPYADMVAVDKALAARNLTADQRKALYAKVWKPINLNTAKAEEILLIPGVGRRMLHEFEEYRPYTSMEQFRREIGKYVDKTELARLEQYVSVK
jgi:DNA uptake protein ComE-like DNA-binding protein